MSRTLKSRNTYVVNGCPPGLSGSRIMLLSDLHLEPGATRFDQKMLRRVTDIVRDREINLLVLAGDILDSLEAFSDPQTREMFKNFLTSVSISASIVLGVGNHDFAGYDASRKITYQPDCFLEYKNFIQSSSREQPVFLLDNSSVRFSSGSSSPGLVLTGLSLPADYYGLSKSKKRRFVEENRFVFWKTLKSTLPDLAADINLKNGGDDWGILFIHSPVHLDILAQNYIKSLGYDTIISGHLHNGGVPFWLEALSGRSERGIIGANGVLFPKRARNTELRSDGTLLTLGATKIIPEENHRLKFRFFSFNFPPDFRFLYLV